MPRGLYGAYLRDDLKQEVRREGKGRLLLVRGEVLALEEGRDGLLLHLDRDRRIGADAALLAIGSFPPAAPRVADPAFYGTPLFRPDPWAPDALAGLDPARPVLLIGSGLTAVDVTISLLDQGHQGPIHALSRRGLLPRRHGGLPAPAPGGPAPSSDSLAALLHHLRAEARRRVEAGKGWQSVVDGLRPVTQSLWQGMAPAVRARFLRHLRPWWEVHRHRMAGPVADRIDAARAAGRLQVRAGRLLAFAWGDAEGSVEVRYRPRGAVEEAGLRVARVVNCSGPGAGDGRIGHPLARHLLAAGMARPDPFGLGLDVTEGCELVRRDGTASPRLLAVGPVTRGTFWEMTAVPDLRRQAEAVARRVAATLRKGPPPLIDGG